MSDSHDSVPPVGVVAVFMRLRQRSPRAFVAATLVVAVALIAGVVLALTS